MDATDNIKNNDYNICYTYSAAFKIFLPFCHTCMCIHFCVYTWKQGNWATFT